MPVCAWPMRGVGIQVPVMTARYAGKQGLAAKMAAAVIAHQDHSIARAAGVAAALMLERVILGQSIPVSVWRWVLPS